MSVENLGDRVTVGDLRKELEKISNDRELNIDFDIDHSRVTLTLLPEKDKLSAGDTIMEYQE